MKPWSHYQEEEEVLVEELTNVGEDAKLVIFNDDHNTFDWVIKCLMEVCKHSHPQSEQLSLIIHFKGKATDKTAPMDVVKPMKDALVERGLSAVVEH